MEEACSEAAATTTVRCCVDSAVLRRLRRGGLELRRGGRDRLHNATDGLLEAVGEPVHLRLAGGGGGLRGGFALLRLALGLLHRLELERLDGARHVADLVLAAEPGQHHVEVALGELAHRAGHRRQRP